MNSEETFYQTMRRQGVARRSSLEYCSLAVTPPGLGAEMVPKIAQALENKPRIPVAQIHSLECTCCTESFIHSAHPLAKDVILSPISLDYDNTLVAAAGTQAEEIFEDIITQYNGKYIPAVEGNPPLGEQRVFCISSGRPFIEKFKRTAAGASAIITWETYASWGCVQAARPNPTQATPIDKVITNKSIIKISDYPPIPDVMNTIITYMMTFDRLLDVDGVDRPLMFYGQRVHDKCYRHAHFDIGEFVQSWDDDTTRKGYYLYKMGCKGPTTYSTCSSTRWNDGVSSPVQSGHGCLGCAENGFQGRGSFYSRVADIP